jgi:hypothetical protein
MRHLILKYYLSLSTCVYAILAVFVGGYAYNNIPRLTDFECLLVSISVFMVLKGITIFTKNIYLK